MTDIAQTLARIREGDPAAAQQLLPLVYDELRQLAARMLAREKPGQTLQATALVHEAYLRVVKGVGDQHWDGRRHFYTATAEAMRRILIDQARHKQSAKGGGLLARVPPGGELTLVAPDGAPVDDLLALDDALRQLETEHPVKAQLIALRFFAGVSLEDAAEMVGVSPATAKRYWVFARAWLFGKVNGQ